MSNRFTAQAILKLKAKKLHALECAIDNTPTNMWNYSPAHQYWTQKADEYQEQIDKLLYQEDDFNSGTNNASYLNKYKKER